MEATEDNVSGSLWNGTVSLEAGRLVKYKYIKMLNDRDPEQCRLAWEAGSNNAYMVPKDDAATALQTDSEVRFQKFIPCNFQSQAVFTRAVLESEISDVEVLVLRDEVPDLLYRIKSEGYDGFVEP
ncbi:hypothetical protein CDD83_6161 [Cordyceps sp. RAO-2017]|nr:hypothetical protein CDD83_6161 [Cordyceps sp. RAO-2017]